MYSCAAFEFKVIKFKKNDEVITSALTFSSTINSIVIRAAKPVLADVEFDTQNIDPYQIEKINKNKSNFNSSFCRRPCNMDQIMKIVKKHNLYLIEDCAHAIESKYKGKNVGTFGTFGCFSFYATKNLSIGEEVCCSQTIKNFMKKQEYYLYTYG